MNEDDHCRPDNDCPKGFKEHANDETGTCFPTKKLLKSGFHGGPIIRNSIRNTNVFSPTITSSATAAATATTVPNGLNATFFDAKTPYYWYVVNAPPCFDIKTGTIIH